MAAFRTVAAPFLRPALRSNIRHRPTRGASSISHAKISDILRPSLDHRYVRENQAEVQANIDARRSAGCAATVARLYDEAIAAQTAADAARADRNAFGRRQKAAATNQLKGADEATLALAKLSTEERASEGRRLKALAAARAAEQAAADERLATAALQIPNATSPLAPGGNDAEVVAVVGERPAPGTVPLSHLDLAERHSLLDFESASRAVGSKFVYLKNEAALLELALTSWAVEFACQRGFTPVVCPDLVRPSFVEACGFAPRTGTPEGPSGGEASQIYRVKGASDAELCLAATAEIPLAGMYAGRTLQREDLQGGGIRTVGVSHCFRTEAGAAGEATKGLYRLHQFTKVELFCVALPEESEAALDDICGLQREMYEALGLHFRVLNMPRHELGAAASRKLDVEAWMPSRLAEDDSVSDGSDGPDDSTAERLGRGAYGEICSASNCTDYQSRRLGIRYVDRARGGDTARKKGRRTAFAHTLNGTACAVPRVLLAILENFQLADGRVEIPHVLRPFMGGREWIGG
jgi:seryl-tRNA synthetase